MESVINKKCVELASKAQTKAAVAKARAERGQGTSEYAILIGVIVVIAVLAVLIFGDKLSELWNKANTQMDSVLGHSFSGQGGTDVNLGGGGAAGGGN